MLLNNTLEILPRPLGHLLRLTSEGDFIGRFEHPGIVFLVFESHSSLGLRQHGVVAFRPDLHRHHSTHRQVIARSPSRGRLSLSIRLPLLEHIVESA